VNTTTTTTRVALALCAALAAHGCDGDEPSEEPGMGIGDGDGDEPDAGGGEDAGRDSGEPSGPAECTLDETELSVELAEADSRTWNLMLWKDRLHLAYEKAVCADTTPGQRIDFVSFASKGEFSTPVTLAGGDDQCVSNRAAVLGASDDDTPRVFFTSSAAGEPELFTKLGNAQTQLTFDADPGDEEQHTTSVDWQGATMLAYVNARPGTPLAEQIVTRLYGAAEQEILGFDSAVHIRDLAIASFPGDGAPGGMLAYVTSDTTGTGGTVNAVPLDREGKAIGEPIVLSTKADNLSNVRVLIQQGESDAQYIGAIVYGVATGEIGSLRFRTLERSGEIGAEVELTSGAVNARGIGIAPFASGYVLAFRLDLGEVGSIHMRVVDVMGNTASYAERELVPAAPLGAAPEVFVTNDGRFTVAFTNVTNTGTTLRVIRATCDP
jgi:hypothetical protein